MVYEAPPPPATTEAGATALFTARSVCGAAAVTLAVNVSFALAGSGVSEDAEAVVATAGPPAVGGLRRAVMVVEPDAPASSPPNGRCTALACTVHGAVTETSTSAASSTSASRTPPAADGPRLSTVIGNETAPPGVTVAGS